MGSLRWAAVLVIAATFLPSVSANDTAGAAPTADQAPAKKEKKAKARSSKGSVVELAETSITVQPMVKKKNKDADAEEPEPVVMEFAEEFVVTIDGAAAELTDVVVGDQVRITYVLVDEAPIASAIAVTR